MQEVEECEKKVVSHFNKKLRLTEEEKSVYEKARICHICGGYVEQRGKVGDHWRIHKHF